MDETVDGSMEALSGISGSGFRPVAVPLALALALLSPLAAIADVSQRAVITRKTIHLREISYILLVDRSFTADVLLFLFYSIDVERWLLRHFTAIKYR